jgi:CelD/BcsL family acetyltransferase involved in cellulose biosynthesis
MNSQFTTESFDSIYSDWKKLQANSSVSSIFSSPEWSKAWWQQFGSEAKLHLGAVRYQGKAVGIAPLLVRNDTASFIGSSDICDYLDFVVEPGNEERFFSELLDNLNAEGILRLELVSLRPDSTVLTSLVKIAPRQAWQISCSQEDVSVELALPATWEEYLQLLSSKQRHELKRKLRRLNEEGELNYRYSTDASRHDVDIFLRLFRDSRQDKAAFLTPQMESFFRAVANAMAEQKLLRLNILELDKKPVAATMCFDYKDTMYLYNSGYEPDYSWLSVGVVSKALCIQDSIERNKKLFDFLKGGEAYKYHLGGHELPLYRCSLSYAA